MAEEGLWRREWQANILWVLFMSVAKCSLYLGQRCGQERFSLVSFGDSVAALVMTEFRHRLFFCDASVLLLRSCGRARNGGTCGLLAVFSAIQYRSLPVLACGATGLDPLLPNAWAVLLYPAVLCVLQQRAIVLPCCAWCG